MAHLDTILCDREADTFSNTGFAGIISWQSQWILGLVRQRHQIAGKWGDNNGTVAYKWLRLPMPVRYFLQNIYWFGNSLYCGRRSERHPRKWTQPALPISCRHLE